MAEDDRVRHLHHRCFHVQREQDAFVFCLGDFVLKERVQRFGGHVCRVNNGTRGVGNALFQDSFATGCFKNDLGSRGFVQRCGHFVREEVTARHGCHACFRVGHPLAHAVRVVLCEFLNRTCGATVRVAFAQNGVHSGTLDRVVTGTGLFFFVCCGRFGIVGQIIALTLKFLDRCNQLRNRSRDVRQFDHVGMGKLHQLTQFCQVVILFLCVCQTLGEGRDNAASQRNIFNTDGHARGGSKAANHWKKRMGRKFRCFVYLCIHNIWRCLFSHDPSPLLRLRTSSRTGRNGLPDVTIRPSGLRIFLC